MIYVYLHNSTLYTTNEEKKKNMNVTYYIYPITWNFSKIDESIIICKNNNVFTFFLSTINVFSIFENIFEFIIFTYVAKT